MSNVEKSVKDAIDELTKKKGDGWFIIFEDQETGKFVQFAWDESEGFHFDLPVQTLSTDEKVRATELLQNYGIQLETWPAYNQPNGVVVGEQSGFSKQVGNDSELAINLSLVVLLSVYGLQPSSKLLVTIDR